MNYETILVERRQQVAWLSLNRPDSLNALSAKMIEELTHFMSVLQREHETRVLVLQAKGKAFCAGLDLKERAGVVGTMQEAYQVQRDIAAIMVLLRKCPQPVIALMQGAVCGGGFGMALAADIRIAAEDCRMNAAFIKIGLGGCDMGTSYFLPRIVGTSVASEYILTGRFMTAQRALDAGLLSAIVAHEEMAGVAQGYIDDMLQTAPMALRLTKDALNLAVDAQSLEAVMAVEDRQQLLLGHTADHREAIEAFMAKRPPQFSDT